jgi:putative ABC transport system permease protein
MRWCAATTAAAAFAEQGARAGPAVGADPGFSDHGPRREEQGGAGRLVALKAVAPGYPLRGSLRVADGPEAPDVPPRHSRPGTAWVDARCWWRWT